MGPLIGILFIVIRATLVPENKANLTSIKIKSHLVGKPLIKHQNHAIERQDKNKRMDDGIHR